jgi:hypothetical protein
MRSREFGESCVVLMAMAIDCCASFFMAMQSVGFAHIADSVGGPDGGTCLNLYHDADHAQPSASNSP